MTDQLKHDQISDPRAWRVALLRAETKGWLANTDAADTLTAALDEIERLREAAADADLIEQAISDRTSDGSDVREVAEYVSECIRAALKGSDQ